MVRFLGARLSQLAHGSIIKVDNQFTCTDEGIKGVHQDSEGLFFYCRKGKHRLEEELSGDGDTLLGIFAQGGSWTNPEG